MTVVVLLLGGESQPVDTEDVAIKANELAPKRFSWRKYPEQVNLELVRVYLSDAKKPEKGGYLLGSGTDGWLLTEAGVRFARKASHALEGVDLSRDPLSPRERQWLLRERRRMLSSEAYAKLSGGRPDAITDKEAEDFFRVDDYVAGAARERRITRIVNSFASDTELAQLVQLLASRLRDR